MGKSWSKEEKMRPSLVWGWCQSLGRDGNDVQCAEHTEVRSGSRGQLKLTWSHGKILLRFSLSCTTHEETSGHTSLHSPQAGVLPRHNVCQFCPARRPQEGRNKTIQYSEVVIASRSQDTERIASLHFCHWEGSTPHYFLELGVLTWGHGWTSRVYVLAKTVCKVLCTGTLFWGEELWLSLISPNGQWLKMVKNH